jgi:hypothetical protein
MVELLIIWVIGAISGIILEQILRKIYKDFRLRRIIQEEKERNEYYEQLREKEITDDLNTWLAWMPHGLEGGEEEARTIIKRILWSEERECLFYLIELLQDYFDEHGLGALKDTLTVIDYDLDRRDLSIAIRKDKLSLETRKKITYEVRNKYEDVSQELYREMGLFSMGDIFFTFEENELI